MALIIDPPNGWMYDFPAKWDKEKYPTYRELLLAHNYPEKYIELAEKHSWMWEEEEKQIEVPPLMQYSNDNQL